jgi:hypothetical protein
MQEGRQQARWSLQGAFGNGQKLEISANLLMLVLLLLLRLLLLLLILLRPPPSFGFVFGGHFLNGPLPPAHHQTNSVFSLS